MPKTPDAGSAASAPRTLTALVPIATGTAGWTGNPVEAGDTLTTSDAAVYDRLVSLLYGRPATDGPPAPSTTSTGA